MIYLNISHAIFFTDHPSEKFGAVSSPGTSKGRSLMNDPGKNWSSAKLSLIQRMDVWSCDRFTGTKREEEKGRVTAN
jgi:hypothetical protein